MSGPAWIKFYASDWLNGARALSLQERGLYITLVAMMYDEGGPISGSDERFARLCGCKVSEFRKALSSLIAEKKIFKVDGGLWNDRVEKEIGKITKIAEKQSGNAKARWSKNADISKADECHGINSAMPDECLLDTRYQIPDISSLRSDNPREEAKPKPPKAPSRFDEFWQTYPKRDGSNPKEPARQKFEQACKRGDDPQAIIDGAARYAEQQKRLGNIGTPYVKQAATWLNAKGWADDYGSPSKSQSPPVNEKAKALIDRLPEHQLLDYVKRYAIGRFTWNADVFGPPPNSPNTLVPPQILKQAKEGIAA